MTPRRLREMGKYDDNIIMPRLVFKESEIRSAVSFLKEKIKESDIKDKEKIYNYIDEVFWIR